MEKTVRIVIPAITFCVWSAATVANACDTAGGGCLSDTGPGINVTDYGVIPDDPTAADANVVALRQMVAPAEHGGASTYIGKLLFPKADYFFDDVIPVRDCLHFDLQGSTLRFTKTAAAEDRSAGFIFAIRDFMIENGHIVVDYDNSAGIVQAGSALHLGTRASGRPYYFPGIYDADLAEPMGNFVVRDIDITADHGGVAHSYGILMFGGLDDVLLERVSVSGQDSLRTGIAYEFGFATEPLDPDTVPKPGPPQSSHARRMTLRDIKITNLSPDKSVGVRLGGTSDVLVEGLHVSQSERGFVFNHGEAAYFNTWRQLPEVPTVTLRKIALYDIAGNGLSLVGSGPFDGGYLLDYVDEPLVEDMIDHVDFVVDGFHFQGVPGELAAGIYVSGRRLEVSNGVISHFRWGILANRDAGQVSIDRVNILETACVGIHLAHDDGVADPPRQKTGHVRNSFVAGAGDSDYHPQAIVLDHVTDFLIEENMFGWAAGETQGISVWLMEDAQHVLASGNTVVGGDGYLSRSLAETNALRDNHGNTRAVGIWQHE